MITLETWYTSVRGPRDLGVQSPGPEKITDPKANARMTRMTPRMMMEPSRLFRRLIATAFWVDNPAV
jgi:hypothetical protein